MAVSANAFDTGIDIAYRITSSFPSPYAAGFVDVTWRPGDSGRYPPLLLSSLRDAPASRTDTAYAATLGVRGSIPGTKHLPPPYDLATSMPRPLMYRYQASAYLPIHIAIQYPASHAPMRYLSISIRTRYATLRTGIASTMQLSNYAISAYTILVLTERLCSYQVGLFLFCFHARDKTNSGTTPPLSPTPSLSDFRY
eukprot:3937070-Rhodomonas_salina.4